MTDGKKVKVYPPSKADKTIVISVRVSEEVAGILRSIAVRNHRNVSQQICCFIERGIEL